MITASLRLQHSSRHVFADTQGLLMLAIVHTADIQDRDSGVSLLMATLFGLYPFQHMLYAGGGYQRPQFQAEIA